MLVVALAKQRADGASHVRELMVQFLQLPGLVEKALALDASILRVAESLVDRQHALFVGRGALSAIAMEGAPKLKEISYIHAEAYPAAELKHGLLALLDEEMPVIAVAPHNELLEKLKSNLQECAHAAAGSSCSPTFTRPWQAATVPR
jgi:glucosamine--fructose-6-phosphate aminotransferase (isomerizing)